MSDTTHARAVSRQIEAIAERLRRGGANGPQEAIHPSAWFLGPNAENEAALHDLAQTAIGAHAQLRRDFHREDPDFVSAKVLRSREHKAALAQVKTALEQITRELRNSIPLASYRNQSHMYWDQTLPAVTGYLAGLLYNQNNVAPEASPVTTALEMIVGEDLCEMLGYDLGTRGEARPWGHITCGGSVANFESLWAARNLKCHALPMAAAIREAVAAGAPLAKARGVTVQTLRRGRQRLLELGPWELLNLPNGENFDLLARTAKTAGLAQADVAAAWTAQSLQHLGMVEFFRRHLGPERPAPVVIVPATAHYSWLKGASLLGLGAGALRAVPVDLDGRMDMPALRRILDDCLARQIPVAQVVAVMGSTEESAVDPLAEICAIRAEYRQMGMEFALHCDAAWGGYFAALLRAPKSGKNAPPDDMTGGFDTCPEEAMSPYVAAQFAQMAQADSITIDPHKSGFIPYPAGALCYRDGRMPRLVQFSAPVIDHDVSVPTVGTFGIEGSKPGAAAVGVALSHRVIPTDQSGYGRLLGRCLWGAKRFYAAAVTCAAPDDPFAITPFQRLPMEAKGGTKAQIEAERARIARHLVSGSNAQITARLDADADLRALFRALGPDLSVFAYAFNLRLHDGVNRDPEVMNAYNRLLFEKMSLQRDEQRETPERALFVTASAFTRDLYGADFVGTFAARAGLSGAVPARLDFLISTMQNPWITATAGKREGGNIIPDLIEALRRSAREAAGEIADIYGLALQAPARKN